MDALDFRQNNHLNVLQIDLTMEVSRWPQDGNRELRRYGFRPSQRSLFKSGQGKVARRNQ
jgi:hypothetical protein